MRNETIRALIELNNRFYSEHAASFSSTRQAPWPGWTRMLEAARRAWSLGENCCAGAERTAEFSSPFSSSHEAPGKAPNARTIAERQPATDLTASSSLEDSPCTQPSADPATLQVLDLACGNMRLASALAADLPSTNISYLGVDTCDALAATAAIAPGNAPNATASTQPASPASATAGTAPRNAAPARQLDLNAPSQAPYGQVGSATLLTQHGNLHASYQSLDILDELLSRGTRATRSSIDAPLADLVCCFGFMHHVPSANLRQALIELLISLARPGGVIALSCWRFMDDARLAAKAERLDRCVTETTSTPALDPADLEPGDHFLGWQNDEHTLRFCHHVDEAELDRLSQTASAVGAREICRFSADGRSDTLNRYLILRRA